MSNKIIVQKNITKLLKIIQEISGDKIITIYRNDGTVYKFDMTDEKFTYGSSGLESIFGAKVLNGMLLGGSIIVRQFTKIKIDSKPVKNIYGVRLGNNGWIPLTAEALEISYSFDNKTRKPIPKAKDLVYCSLNI